MKDELDLGMFSRLLSQKTGRETVIVSALQIGGGYHSEGFQLTTSDGRSFFLKYVRSHDLGFEFPERQIASLLVSNGMGMRAKNNPAPVGVVVADGDTAVMLPEITDTTKVYHLQEFAGTGTSYSALLKNNLKKQLVDDEDRARLSVVADALVKIHSVKHFSNDSARLKAIYGDGLRNILSNPELSLMVLSEFPVDYEILDLDGQKEFISLMYDNIRERMGRYDRLTALHGDFWGANIFFKEDGDIFIIDFSRIPWGDPGTDVGWFIAEHLWYYHLTGNPYFRELIETWFRIYEEKSGDKEIRKAVPLVIGWIGIVQIYPRWFPDIDVTVGKNFIGHVKEILRRKEFVW